MKNRYVQMFSLLITLALSAQAQDRTTQAKFASGGSIRFHLESGGYTITPTDSDTITVTCHAESEARARRVRVEIQPSGASAEVYVHKTPHNHFQATIEVPRRSRLWVRLTAGEVDIDGVEGDKDVEAFAGQIVIAVPHPEVYGHSDASVTTGSIEASAFDVSKGGLFRSFDHSGAGSYTLHAHVMAGEIDLKAAD